jgi:hypothetical protein
LTDKTYRTQCLLNVYDPVVLKNWDAISSDKQYQSAIALLLTKIGSLLMSPMIRNIVGQNISTLRKATIIIANLDRAKIGDLTARLLGGLLIARSSGQVVINDYPFFRCEVPLAQDRFALAVNYLDELPKMLQQAVLGIEEKIVLRTNPQDAVRLHGARQGR